VGGTLPRPGRGWVKGPLLKTSFIARPTPQATCAAVEISRRRRYTGRQIAAELGISPATVSRILRRLGLNRLAALEPAEPVRRYEREHPGELIHIDIKKLGKATRRNNCYFFGRGWTV
jgi:transcription initiation factor IIE alpha subunit